MCNLYASEANYMFVVKSLMRTQPYIVNFTAMTSIVLIFGYAIRVCESPLNRNDTSFNYFVSYWNSMWYIIVTMTTLGYGDFYARTTLGRAIIFFVCIAGVFTVSTMVVTIAGSLETSPLENKAITLIERLELRKKMQN